ncbi:MAG TPA: DNA translocase FtsK 4TM domain-containing protein, partial [Vicinamibacteria bacterium]|nr:DNA translocase FtsK 4TM domain-containing protein [Vicinamibacteria bacterium]
MITKSRRLSEFLGLLSFGLALMLLTSLATYDPSDPAVFFKAGRGGPARNFIGPLGAFLAELFIPQLFGLAALLLPLVLGLVGWKLFWCRPLEAAYTKATGVGLLLLSLTALLALSVGFVGMEGEQVRAGGAVGELLAGRLVAGVNRPGAYILLATALFVSIILATQFSFATFLSVAGGHASARLRVVATAWARFRETRRKEKMRQEVLRKHAQREVGEAEAPGRRRKGRPAPAEEDQEEAAADDVRWELGEEGEAEAEDEPEPKLPALRSRAVQKPLPFSDTDMAEAPEDAPARGKKKERASEPGEGRKKGGPRGSFPLPSAGILDPPMPQQGMDRAR